VSERPVFNVAQLLKEPVGATRSGFVDVDLRTLAPDADFDLIENRPDAVEVTGPVRLMHVTNGVLVQGSLTADVTLPCSRCLEPVTTTLKIPLEETFESTVDMTTGQIIRPEEEDEALWIDEHHILDLTEALRQDMLVELPVHVVCREDCRGLCPSCGKNLNEGDCDCVAEPDPRWASLQSLLKDEETEENE
jgi:uncharacterized protein